MFHFGARLRAALGSPDAQLACTEGLSPAAAFPLLVKAAKSGVPAAWCRLGRAYLLGQGVPPSLPAALRWLTRAGEAGDVEAQTLLASLALRGTCDAARVTLFETAPVDPHPDHEAALRWASPAAAQGSAEALAILGYLLTGGPAAMLDPARGEQCYHDSAAAGCAQGQLGWALILLRRGEAAAAVAMLEKAAAGYLPTAQYMLGAIAESGAAGTADFAAAAEHYRIAADWGHATAQFRYGVALLTGRGVAVDAFRAESWLRRAALGGEPAAAAAIGDLYRCPGPLPPNPVEAAVWLRRAAEAGHAGAAASLGHLLLGTDPDEAALWLRQAGAGGEAGARDDLAGLALAGQAGAADQQAVCHWFRAQAEAGDPAAAYNLGLCLAQGIGVPQDDAAALEWFERAAASVPAAMYWYGLMRADGRGGCEPDPFVARAWFLRAAEAGYADAQALAGEMLVNGRGGAADREAGLALFRRAAAGGHAGAVFALKVLGGEAG